MLRSAIMGGEFNLHNTPGLQMWYEVDAPDYYTLISGEANNVADRGGSARNLTAGAGTRRPELDIDGMNGRPTLVFHSATNDILSSGAITGLTNLSYLTVMCAVRIDVAGNNHVLRNTTSTGYLLIDTNGAIWVTFAADYSQYGYSANGVIAVGTPYIITIMFDGTQASFANRLRVYVNGELIDLTFSATLPTTLTLATISLGSYASYGLLDGSISAAAWFSGTTALSRPECQRIECHWGAKYGAFDG